MRRLAVLSFHTSPLAQPGTGDGGGMNVYVRELTGALAAAGVDCDVYTRAWRPGLASTVRVGPGLRVHHVTAGPPELLGIDELVALVPEFTEGVAARFSAGLDPDVISANYWLSGLSGHVLKHRFGLPLVSTFHSLARVKAEADVPDRSERARAEAEIVACSDSIVVSSDHEASELVRLYGAAPERTEVVAPGVDHSLFHPGSRTQARAELGLDVHGRLLLFVGRIQPLKGLDVAVRALAALGSPATLVVVGGPSGPDGQSELRRVRGLIDSYGLQERVRLVAAQPHPRLVSYYRAADVCLVPSRSESFGLVALEAAACGTPVVAAAVGGLRTVVDHGVTGFLVDAGRPEAFADAASLLLEDPALATTMGERAAARASRFRWSITAARLRRLYADLTAQQLVECQ